MIYYLDCRFHYRWSVVGFFSIMTDSATTMESRFCDSFEFHQLHDTHMTLYSSSLTVSNQFSLTFIEMACNSTSLCYARCDAHAIVIVITCIMLMDREAVSWVKRDELLFDIWYLMHKCAYLLIIIRDIKVWRLINVKSICSPRFRFFLILQWSVRCSMVAQICLSLLVLLQFRSYFLSLSIIDIVY